MANQEVPMCRMAIRVAAAAILVALGWAAGRAQSSQPDFELVVTAPVGQTKVECRRGCELAWVERGVHPDSKPMTTFEFGCKGGAVTSCFSARIGGWLRQSDR
jgi:hypothetical protein